MTLRCIQETAAYPLIHAFLHDQVKNPWRFPTAIDAEDEMFVFDRDAFFGGDAARAALCYFTVGKRIYDALAQISSWYFEGLRRVTSILDFGAGYGRVTRFLLQDVPAARIWAAEINPNGARFQCDYLHVNGVVSTHDPEAFQPPERFDLIFAASFLSQVPQEAFFAWICRLYELLSPSGLLVFSVHDMSQLPQGLASQNRDFHFHPESEIPSLSGKHYGASYVSESFLREWLTRLLPGVAYQRIENGLEDYQDIYVVPRCPARRRPPLQFPYHPRGAFDGGFLGPNGILNLSGWGIDCNEGDRTVEIQVKVNGRAALTCVPSLPRPDIVQRFSDPSFRFSGWSCSVAGIEPSDTVLVKACNRRGLETVLWISDAIHVPYVIT